jgi:hypothetical protein
VAPGMLAGAAPDFGAPRCQPVRSSLLASALTAGPPSARARSRLIQARLSHIPLRRTDGTPRGTFGGNFPWAIPCRDDCRAFSTPWPSCRPDGVRALLGQIVGPCAPPTTHNLSLSSLSAAPRFPNRPAAGAANSRRVARVATSVGGVVLTMFWRPYGSYDFSRRPDSRAWESRK